MHLPIAALKPHQQPRPIRRVIRIGPDDDGRRMSLKDFARAEGAPGYLYELANGVIEVSNIPDLTHGGAARQIIRAVATFDAAHPDVITYFAGGADAKIEMFGRESERHPDLSIYLTPAPAGTKQPWNLWVPDIVIEVVSASSAKRDYEVKPHDYLAAGVREYWIIDPRRRSGLFLLRRVDAWIEPRLGPRGKWRTSLLPGFTLDLASVFASIPKER